MFAVEEIFPFPLLCHSLPATTAGKSCLVVFRHLVSAGESAKLSFSVTTTAVTSTVDQIFGGNCWWSFCLCSIKLFTFEAWLFVFDCFHPTEVSLLVSLSVCIVSPVYSYLPVHAIFHHTFFCLLYRLISLVSVGTSSACTTLVSIVDNQLTLPVAVCHMCDMWWPAAPVNCSNKCTNLDYFSYYPLSVRTVSSDEKRTSKRRAAVGR